MKPEIMISVDGNEDVAKKRTFRSGKEGYGFYGKIEIDGERFQVSCNVVKIR